VWYKLEAMPTPIHELPYIEVEKLLLQKLKNIHHLED
jgi:hypothetical protein